MDEIINYLIVSVISFGVGAFVGCVYTCKLMKDKLDGN